MATPAQQLFKNYRVQSQTQARFIDKVYINQNYLVKITPIGNFETPNGTRELFDVYTISGKAITTDAVGACALSNNAFQICFAS